MHGDFLAEMNEGGGKLIGGVSLLSGYLNKVRSEVENVIYVISGDMVQGSLIDSEYKGISTIEIMNYLSPDVVTLGNHELDYGLPHLLFLEKMANFPIVNSNLYIKKYGKRLMRPYLILRKAGCNILFTGVITEKIMDTLSRAHLIGTFIALEDAATEIGKICNSYRDSDMDLTIALTHIGLGFDKKLAAMLDPDWGVDMIIGGHSHSILEQPEQVNDILITQAGTGTDYIGRFDISVDTDTNTIAEWNWELVPINDTTAQPDKELEAFIHTFKDEVDAKYNSVVTRFSQKLFHACREEETTLGNLVADILSDVSSADIVMVGSGSIRQKKLGPVVTLGDLKACFPFEDSLSKYYVSGKSFSRMISHIMRIENRNGEGEFYQFNNGIEIVYSDTKKEVISIKVGGESLIDDQIYSITLQGFHYLNSKEYLNITNEELLSHKKPIPISTSQYQVLEEWLRNHPNESRKIEGRIVFV